MDLRKVHAVLSSIFHEIERSWIMHQELEICGALNAVGLCVTVHAQLRDNLEAAEQAAAFYRSDDLFAAQAPHDYLEARYAEVLALIGRLTNAEAESVEPAFTRFECALARLNAYAAKSMPQSCFNEKSWRLN
jgi:hypothetical protein